MASPTPFLIEHKEIILKHFHQNDSKPKKTWESLHKILPQLSATMRFNTFKQHISVFAVVTNGLDKVIQIPSIGTSVLDGLDKKPKRIDGWNVQQSKDGYFRCYRKIAKRVHSVYIGKDLDLKKAQMMNVNNCH